VLGQEAKLCDIFFALDPAGFRHGVLLYELSGHEGARQRFSLSQFVWSRKFPRRAGSVRRLGCGEELPGRRHGDAVHIGSTDKLDHLGLRRPGLPSSSLSASGFAFLPAPMRAPPRLVPSFAKTHYLL
jgi:hypothetical protein